jgi:hypothetical protein
MMIEAGLVAGYVIAWVTRKARRALGQLDAEADAVIDAGFDRLHEVVAEKLREHPSLAELDAEAAGGGNVSELTRQQIEQAIAAAALWDDRFGRAVTDLARQLRGMEGATRHLFIGGSGARVFTGDAHVKAEGRGIAFGQIAGDVHVHQGGDRQYNPSEYRFEPVKPSLDGYADNTGEPGGHFAWPERGNDFLPRRQPRKLPFPDSLLIQRAHPQGDLPNRLIWD